MICQGLKTRIQARLTPENIAIKKRSADRMHRFRLTSGKCSQVKAWQMLYIRSKTMQYLEWILCISRVSSNSQDTNHRKIEEHVLTQLLSLNAYSVWSSLEVIIIITCTLGRISRLSKARVRAHGNQSALCADCAQFIDSVCIAEHRFQRFYCSLRVASAE